MPFVIPTGAATGIESLVLDGLNLSQGEGGAIRLDSFTPPLFKKRVEWVEAADSNGAILARDPLESVGDATVRVAVVGVSRDDAQSTVGQIVGKLEESERNPLGIPLVWTPSDSTTSVTAYVLTGEVTEMPVDWESGYMVNQPLVTFTLSCRPGWYGAPVTYTKTATAGPLVTMDLADVPGDVPADATLTVTEASSQSRRTVEWGAEQRYYNPSSPWSLVLDSDNLVTSGFAGTQTTRTGAYDPGATGNSIIVSFIPTRPQAICGTGAQPHVGTFLVKARVYTQAPSNFYVQLAWRVGDGDYVRNDPANVTIADRFTEIDLGLVTIPPASTGTQSWDGRLEAWTTAYTSDDIEVDYLMLIPVEAGYGKARASYSYSPGVLVARDAFNGTTAGVALNGRTADAGGTWATSGAGTDFAFQDTAFGVPRETATRSTVSDASARFAILGAANFTDTSVAVGIMSESLGSAFAAEWGLIARWTDASNYLRGVINSTGAFAVTFNLVQRVAGVDTTLASENLNHLSLSVGQDVAVRLIAFSSGRAILQMYDTSATLIAVVEASSTALATGGALATGKPGLYDFNSSAGAGTRRYDDVYVETPALEPIALYSGRSLQIGSDDTLRESSAGGTWGRPQTYRGSRFRVQPAGTADRTTRVAVKASRNDLDTAEDLNLTDTISLAATITPRYSVVPRA